MEFMSDIQPIDPEVLLESVCGDKETALELLDLFFELVGREMDDIGNAIAAEDVASVAALAHKMVGSSMACGLAGFAGGMADMEKECRKNGMPSDAGERVQRLALQLSEARAFFESSWKEG